MECEFCHNTLANKGSLKYHQKTAKYCLKLRGKCDALFRCKGCNQRFTVKQSLSRHEVICIEMRIKERDDATKDRYEERIRELQFMLEEREKHLENQQIKYDNQIKELQDKLENVAISAVSRPTTTNKHIINNYINRLEVITDEHLLEQSSYLTIEHIQKGPEGYAEYALEYPLKNRIVCVDYSRRKVKFKDREGRVVTDPEMGRLATKFFDSIKNQNHALIAEYGEQLKKEAFTEHDIDKLVEIASYRSAINKGSEGEKTEFYHDFVKNVCSGTVV